MTRDTTRLDPAFDPRIADWLEADPDRAPREVLDTILAALPSVPQRRAFRVPWRFPLMLTPTRAVMAAVLGVLLIGGSVLLSLRPGPSNIGTPGASPSPSPMSAEAYTTARDRLCRDASTALDPLKARFVGIWDGSLTDAQRQDWIAALETFNAGYDRLIADLDALHPPGDWAQGHADDVRDFRFQRAQIDLVISDLRSHRDADAHVADAATDPVSIRIQRFEAQHALVNCP